jgi:hypothetical protein
MFTSSANPNSFAPVTCICIQVDLEYARFFIVLIEADTGEIDIFASTAASLDSNNVCHFVSFVLST